MSIEKPYIIHVYGSGAIHGEESSFKEYDHAKQMRISGATWRTMNRINKSTVQGITVRKLKD